MQAVVQRHEAMALKLSLLVKQQHLTPSSTLLKSRIDRNRRQTVEPLEEKSLS